MNIRRFFRTAALLPVTMALNCGGFFGGGQSSPSIPAPPPVAAPEPVPDISEREPEAKAVRDDEARKLRQRGGVSGTVLTSPLGLPAETGNWLGKSLLGKPGL